MIEEFRFGLDFNSPAFLSGVPRGKKCFEYLKKGRAGQNELKRATPDHYPADPRGIRIPSLRGVLEFWHRALQGDAASTQEVFDRQTKAFGSADGGQGLTIRPAGMPKFESDELCFDERDEKPYSYLYLGYGPLQLVRLPTRTGDTQGYQAATTYHVDKARDAIKVSEAQRNRFRFIARGTTQQIEALKRALTLLHLFGGLGSRSRRGWGSVEVTAEGIQPPKANAVPADWIASILGSVWTSSQYPAGKGDPDFSAFSRGTRICVTAPIEGDYRKVLTTFYERFRAIRSYKDNRLLAVADHDLEKGDFDRGVGAPITGVPARLAFGMPYQPGHPKGWTMEYRGRPQGAGDSEDDVSRRASPLLLKVVRLGPKSHFGVALFLRSNFFGDPDLEIGVVGRNGTQPFPGYGAIEQFLSGSGWTEVKLPQ